MTFFDALLHLGEREEEELVVGEVGAAGQRAPLPGSLPRPEAGEGAEGGLQAPVVRDVFSLGQLAVDGAAGATCAALLRPLLLQWIPTSATFKRTR